MIHTSASGERAALRGYRWQYDQIAARVYDALLDGDFESLRLTDPQAGRVDDLVLIRRGRADGYQFKSVEFDGYLTFRQVINKRPAHTRRQPRPFPAAVPRGRLETSGTTVGKHTRSSRHEATRIGPRPSGQYG